MDQTGSRDASDIEESLKFLVCDAIGGTGSVSLISGGAADQRHAIIADVLMEAEEMGCLTAICDCSCPTSEKEPMAKSLSALWSTVDGRTGADPVTSMERTWPPDRSYRREMAGLDILRSIAADNTVLVIVEEIGAADLDTMVLFNFLARNVRGMNVMILATHSRMEEDQILEKMFDEMSSDLVVQVHWLPETDRKQKCDGKPVRHLLPIQVEKANDVFHFSGTVSQIEGKIGASQVALMSGDAIGSVGDAKAALEDSTSIGHYGLMLDSYIALGVSLTHTGSENEALKVLDRATGLARMINEPLPRWEAHLRKAELLLFSIGELDSAFNEANIADDMGARTLGGSLRLEPLALKAIIEAGNGRRDWAEKAFCDASGILEELPTDSHFYERMLLALAAALLLESRHDLAGMNARYREAAVLATGTNSPIYWSAIISLQHARSLLRLRRPMEASNHLDASAQQFVRLGNVVQHARVRRVAEASEAGPVPD